MKSKLSNTYMTGDKKGFTLVEVLVATFFMVVMIGVVSNILVHNIRLQRFSLQRQELLNETSYVLEYMGRSIRMARKGVCVETYNYDISTGIKFTNYNDECQQFYLSEGKIYETRGSETVPLTSEKVSVEKFQISVTGDEAGQQPFVTLFLEVKIPDRDDLVQIQTTVSQRRLNI